MIFTAALINAMNTARRRQSQGVAAALSSAFFLGLAPVFGKQAINLGVPPIGVVALRTIFAALLLLGVILLFKRQFLYIYPAGLLGCFLAGGINGLGSLFYYASLGRIDASLGQLLYSLYPLFVVLFLWLDSQPPSRLTIVRLFLILPGMYLLLQAKHQPIDLVGVAMMLISSALYAMHLPINQRVLYDMPAPTVTLYTLLAMSAVVVPAYGLSYLLGGASIFPAVRVAWGPIAGLTLVTFLSRLTLFLGVKNLGGIQTALLGLGELLVTIFFAHFWLGEKLATTQWVGAIMLLFSLGMIAFEKTAPQRYRGGLLSWLRPPGLPKDMPWPHE